MINNTVFGKNIENVRKHRNIKLAITEKRNYLISKTNYHTTKFFTENLLAVEIEETQIHRNKPVYLGMSVVELSKTVMYKFCYDYVEYYEIGKVNKL